MGSGKLNGQPPGASRLREVFSRLHLRAAPLLRGNIFIERGAVERHEKLPYE